MRQQLSQGHTAIVIVGMLFVAAPHQPNPFGRLPAKSLFPQPDLFRVAGEISPLIGYIVKRRAKGKRQAEQRTVAIKIGQGLAPGYNFVDALQMLEKRRQRLLDL